MPRKLAYRICPLVFALAAAWNAPIANAAPSLVGHTLEFQRSYPTVGTPFGPGIADTTVVAGNSDAVTWAPAGNLLATIDPEAEFISFSLRPTAYESDLVDFDGYVVSGFDVDIASVSVRSNTTSYGIELAHGLRSFTLGLFGRAGNNGLIEINVQLREPAPPSGVPVPATSLLLLPALGWMGWSRAKTRRRPAQ